MDMPGESTSADPITSGYEPVLIDGYVPLIDLGPAISGDPAARVAVGTALDDACRNSGFFLVTGHGIDPRADRPNARGDTSLLPRSPRGPASSDVSTRRHHAAWAAPLPRGSEQPG